MLGNARSKLQPSIVALEELFSVAEKCLTLVKKELQPQKTEPVLLSITIYIFALLYAALLNRQLSKELLDKVNSAFDSILCDRFQGIGDQKLMEILNEQLANYSRIFQDGSGADEPMKLHNYVIRLLIASSFMKEPTNWIIAKEPLILIGAYKEFAIQGALAAMEIDVIYPFVKRLSSNLDALLSCSQSGKSLTSKEALDLCIFLRQNSPWKKLPEIVTNELAVRFARYKESLIKPLLRTLSNNNGVKKLLMPICKHTQDPARVMIQFAQAMYHYGNQIGYQIYDPVAKSDKVLAELISQGKAYYECAIAIECHYYKAKFQLAMLYQLPLEHVESDYFCQGALDDIDYISSEPEKSLPLFERNEKGNADLLRMRAKIVEYLSELKKIREDLE